MSNANGPMDTTRSYALQKRNYDFRAITLNTGSIKGFEACVAVNDSGAVVAENNRKGVDLQALAGSISVISKQMIADTRELGIGSFHTGEFDGPWGHVYINVLGDTTLITQCDKSAHGEDVLARLDRIIESCSKPI